MAISTWDLSFQHAAPPPDKQGPGNPGILGTQFDTLPAKPMFGGRNVPLVIGNHFLQKNP